MRADVTSPARIPPIRPSPRQRRKGGGNVYKVVDDDCVGCNLCLHVCPIPDCITMVKEENGKPKITWPEHPDNPLRIVT